MFYLNFVIGNWFSINLVNGTIKTIHTLDREEQEEFQLTIMVKAFDFLAYTMHNF